MVESPRVLVVGEGDATRRVVERLDGAGFSVEDVDGVDALGERLAAHRCDSVVGVGDVGGDGAVEAVRVVREAASELPFVLYADGDQAAAAESVVTAGIADLVQADPVGGLDRLTGRVRNAVSRGQAVRRAERQARLNEAVREVNQALVRADDREAVEEAVCRRLVAGGGYAFAWLASVDDDGAVGLRAMGVDGGAVEGHGAVSVEEGTAFTDTVRAAHERGEVVVTRDVAGRGGVWEAALGASFTAVAAVPVAYDDVDRGVLVLYADRPDAFDPEERGVLAELGDTVGYALHAVAVRRRMARREAELERQNERLEAFASVVSHDLRNPLNVAQGYAEALDGEAADRVAEALDRMERIVGDVLELARQGRTIETPAPVELAGVAREAWATADVGDAALAVDTDAVVLADGDRLGRLLGNLFRNAREHGDAGAVRVVAVEDDGAVVGFAVEDDGTGIPAGQREQVLEAGVSTAEDGTGFGLPIVAEIAGAHGWELAVGESPDGGARFAFTGVETPDGGAAPPG